MSLLIKAIAVFILVFSWVVNAKDSIILWDKNYHVASNIAFIRLAADLTKETYGDYEILASAPLEQGRAFANLEEARQINVMIAAVNTEREQRANAVYMPVDRGLVGFRLCLIRDKDKDAFANINTLRDFRQRQLHIGVGTHWPDKNVLDFNRLSATTTPIAEDLYAMLGAGRFACFSRSIKEISMDLANRKEEDFSIEKNIAFIYPLADFIFVSKSESRIKQRLEEGLRLALANGQFYELFDQHFKQSLWEHNLYNRKLFFLKNKNMSEKARNAINQYGIASFSSNY